jgi:hypothetical protein
MKRTPTNKTGFDFSEAAKEINWKSDEMRTLKTPTWFVTPRDPIMYKVAINLHKFNGSQYLEFARDERGKVKRFFRLHQAQAYVEMLKFVRNGGLS